MKKWRYPLLLITAAFSGCSVGPVYEPPITDIPCQWHSDISETVNTDPLECLVWWESFQDPLLNDLIACAATQNLDLRIAALRVLQARSIAKAKKGDLYPHIDGSVNYDHVYYSKDALVNGLLGTACPTKHNVRRNVNFFELGFDADWEIDLFGMTAHEINALQAHAEAVQLNLSSIWVTLSAEIAKNYVEIRGLQMRLLVAQEIIQTQENALKLTQELLERGLVTDSDVSRLQAALSESKAQKPLIELDILCKIHRISILLGQPPGEFYACLQTARQLPSLPTQHPIGVPSELLRRRPDIRKAERELAAATERVGSAIAALFPRFSLRGFVGDISTHAGSLFNPASATWLAGPQLLVPIFNSRLLLQEVDYNKLVTQEALFNYQKTVLEALEESENGIAGFRLGEKRLQHLEEAYLIHKKSFEIADRLYQTGVNDYLTVVAGAKTLLAAEDLRIQGQVDQLLHYISLYKALGGSWE